MKAGGVKFADTPEEAAAHAADDPRARDQRPHAASASSSTPRPRSSRSTTPRVALGRPRQAPDDAVPRHGRHRHRGGRREAPRPRRPRPPLEPASRSPTSEAKEVVAATGGLTGRELNRATPILARLARLQRDYDMTLAEINPLARLSDGCFVALDAHMEMEDEAVGRHQKTAARRSASSSRRHARALRALRVRAQRQGDRRRRPPRRDPGQGPRLQRQPRPRDRRRRRLADPHRRGPQPGRQARQLLRDRRQPLGRQGLRPGQGGAEEGRRREDRGDDVDRLQHPGRHRRPRRDQGLPRARQGPGRDDRDLPHPRRLGGGGLRRSSTSTASSTATAPSRCGRPPGEAVAKIQGGGRDEHPSRTRTSPSSSRGSPGARRST